MEWIWDANKGQENRRKHGVAFKTARRVFDDPLSLTVADPYPHEPRWRTIGMVKNVLLLVVRTDLEPHRAVGRIISARKATRYERKRYEEG
ncbi:MAG: BrnT family toxin [Rhodospirillales bacterium]